MENVCIRAVVNREAVDLQPGNPLRDISGALIDDTEADKRLGVPVREAVRSLPHGITVSSQNEREGILQILVPLGIVQEVEARLRARIALNEKRVWYVVVNVGPDATGDEPPRLVNQKVPVLSEGHRAAA